MKTLLNTLLFLSLTFFIQAKDKVLTQISIKDTTGKTYQITGVESGLKIAGLEGKIVFLEFFGHQCPPCLASIPHLISLQKKHADKLVILAIEVQGYNSKQTAQFAKNKGINYITVSSHEAGELINYIEQRAQWQGGIPFLVALDGKGAVQVIRTGMIAEQSLEKIIQKITKNAK
jgi:thiol-disulfide isomerase/thioredoxin